MGVTQSVSVHFRSTKDETTKTLDELLAEQEIAQMKAKSYPEIGFDLVENSPMVKIVQVDKDKDKKTSKITSQDQKQVFFTTVLCGEEDRVVYEMVVNKVAITLDQKDQKEDGGGTSVVVYNPISQCKLWRQPFKMYTFKQDAGKLEKVMIPVFNPESQSIHDPCDFVTVDVKTGALENRTAKYSYEFSKTGLSTLKNITFYIVPSGFVQVVSQVEKSDQEVEIKKRENALKDFEISLKERASILKNLEISLDERSSSLKQKEQALVEAKSKMDDLAETLKEEQATLNTQALNFATALREFKNEIKTSQEKKQEQEKTDKFVVSARKSKHHFDTIENDGGRMGKEILDRVAPGQTNVFIHCKNCGDFCTYRRTLTTDGVQWLWPKSAKPQEISNFISGYSPADTGSRLWFGFEKDNLPAATMLDS